MLGEYADAAGLELIGIKRLFEHLLKPREPARKDEDGGDE